MLAIFDFKATSKVRVDSTCRPIVWGARIALGALAELQKQGSGMVPL